MKTKKERRISIRLGIFLGYGILMLSVVAAICTGAIYVTKKIIITEIGNSRIDVLSQIGARTKLIKHSMLTLSNLIYNDATITEAVDKNFGDDKIQEQEKLIRGITKNYESAYKELDLGIYTVISSDNFDYCSESHMDYDFNRIDKCLWYKDVAKKSGDIYWVSTYDDTYLKNEGHYVFSAARIYYDEHSGKRTGILMISVPERVLLDTYRIALNGNNSIYIVDAQGKIVSHDNPRLLGLNYYDMDRFYSLVKANHFSIIEKVGQKYLLSNYYDEMTGWTIVEEIPLASLMAPMRELTGTILCITIACLFLAFCLSYILARLTSKPIKILCQRMEKIKDGNMDVSLNISGWEETRELGESFNRMLADLRMLMEQVREKEEKRRIAELDFLQMQINPHFWYNTLFSIKCMVEMGKTQNAVKMMDIFIPLLKEGISSSQELIYIIDESRWIQRFVSLLQFRYEESIQVSFHIEEGLENCYIPRMLLQPIVENSVYHGLDEGENVQIWVDIFTEDEMVHISVTDNGRGISQEVLKAIEEGQWRKNRFNKIGLSNVKERIQIIFGKQYGLAVKSTVGKGTVVTMTIPRID